MDHEATHRTKILKCCYSITIHDESIMTTNRLNAYQQIPIDVEQHVHLHICKLDLYTLLTSGGFYAKHIPFQLIRTHTWTRCNIDKYVYGVS